jgi:hypothetical protein
MLYAKNVLNKLQWIHQYPKRHQPGHDVALWLSVEKKTEDAGRLETRPLL